MFLCFASENNGAAIRKELNIAVFKITDCEILFGYVVFDVLLCLGGFVFGCVCACVWGVGTPLKPFNN